MAAGLWGLAFALSICSIGLASSSPSIVVPADDGSVLQALLESHYSEWMELVEQAQMLHPLEQLVSGGYQLTIFAPQNHQLQPQIKAFVLKPSNAHLLKKLVQFHVLPQRIAVSRWRDASLWSVGGEVVTMRSEIRRSGVDDSDHNATGARMLMFAGEAQVTAPDVIVRADGVVHGVDQMLIPPSVELEYVSFTTRGLAVPLPTGAPALPSRRVALDGQRSSSSSKKAALPRPTARKSGLSPDLSPASPPPPALALPPAVLAPAPAPGPAMGPSAAPFLYGKGTVGEKELTTFISALKRFGGYEEFAGLVVDMTSLGWEISKLVNEGYKLTILAPEDKAWKNALTQEQLSSPTELENILHFHLLAEYHTEESIYTTAIRKGKTTYATMLTPLTLSAREVDGQVVFGEGKMVSGIVDHDIHADGRISVQGVDQVLIPPSAELAAAASESKPRGRSVLEMLQLPSRLHFSEGVTTAATRSITIFASLASVLVLAMIDHLV